MADFFCINAAALYIADRADSYTDGLEQARDALAAGKAQEKLEALRRYQADPA